MNKKMLIQAPFVKAEETMKKCRQTPLFKVIVFIATYVKSQKFSVNSTIFAFVPT